MDYASSPPPHSPIEQIFALSTQPLYTSLSNHCKMNPSSLDDFLLLLSIPQSVDGSRIQPKTNDKLPLQRLMSLSVKSRRFILTAIYERVERSSPSDLLRNGLCLNVLCAVVAFVDNSPSPLDECCAKLCFMTVAVISRLPGEVVSANVLSLSENILCMKQFSGVFEWFDRGDSESFDAISHGNYLRSLSSSVPSPPSVSSAQDPSPPSLSNYIIIGAKRRKKKDESPAQVVPTPSSMLPLVPPARLDQSTTTTIIRVQSLLQDINPNPVSTEVDDISSSLFRLLSDRDADTITLIGSELFGRDESIKLPDSVILNLTQTFLRKDTPKRITVAYIGGIILPVVFGLKNNASRVLLSCLEGLQGQALIDGLLLPVLFSTSSKSPQMDFVSRILKQSPLTSSTAASLLNSLATSSEFSVNDSNAPFFTAIFKNSPAISTKTLLAFSTMIYESVSKDSGVAKSLKVSSLALAIVQKCGKKFDEETKQMYAKIVRELKSFMAKRVDAALKKL